MEIDESKLEPWVRDQIERIRTVHRLARQSGYYGSNQFRAVLGLQRWQFGQARRLGMIPGPDVPHGRSERWSVPAVRGVIGGLTPILQAIGHEPPIGAAACAERLTERTGLPVTRVDVVALADRGHLFAAGDYRGYPLYAVPEVDRLPVDLVAETVAADAEWLADTPDRVAAAVSLGMSPEEFAEVAAEAGVAADRLGRFTLDQVRLVDGARGLTAQRAARRLGVRDSDWRRIVAVGWVAPMRYTTQVWHGKVVDVPLYRAAEVDGLLARPVDWDAVRAASRGSRSLIPHPAPAVRPARSRSGPIFRARLPGVCGWCSEPFRADDQVGFVDDVLFCQVCHQTASD